MRKLLATATVAIAAFFATPTDADAGIHVSIGSSHTYVSGYASCGCPIYTKRVFRGYDCNRRPVYSYYRQPFRHRASCSRGSYRHHGHSSRVVIPRHSYSRSQHHYRGHSRHYRRGSSCGRY